MVQLPADKYLLQDYRDDLRTADAPQWLETEVPITPVKSIGAGFPKPNSKQIIKKYTAVKSTAGSAVTQVASVSASTKIYFLGAFFTVTATAGSGSVSINDSTSGSPTLTNGATNEFFGFNGAAAAFANEYWIPAYPIPCIEGLRVNVTGPTTGTSACVVYYMEELV